MSSNKSLEPVTHISSLDGVRAIAALLILWLHFWSVAEGSTSLVNFLVKTASIGQIGVPLFFVLSGFLISRILLRKKGENDYFRSFYLKRSLRIFPLYYFFLLLVFFIYPLIVQVPVTPLSLSWPNWLYLQNFAMTFNWHYEGPGHLWSLAVEEHFYILWPIIVYYTNLKQLKRICIAVCVAEPIVRYFMFSSNIEVFYFSFTRFDELCFGALLAIAEAEKKILSSLVLRITAVVCLTALVFCFVKSGERSLTVQVFKFSLLGMLFYSGLALLLKEKVSVVSHFFSSKPLMFIGKISYGLYIYHPFAFLVIETYFSTSNVWVNFISCITSSFALSITSYYLLEKPFLRLKDKVDRHRQKSDQKHNKAIMVLKGNSELVSTSSEK